jgi:erythromycin esterase
MMNSTTKNTSPLLLLLFLTAPFYTTPADAQKQIKAYVTEKSVPIATIDPDSTDFSDLKPIGDAIGGSRIVMLGEQYHGDAPAYLLNAGQRPADVAK